mgnify:CR=1 FL=1
MADLINRDHAAQAIEAYLCNQCDHDTDCDPECIACPHLDGAEILKSVPAVNRWISVENSLPENKEIVWVCLYWGKDVYVRKGYIKDELWYTADGYRMCIIPKFWMHEYVPEPPESRR